MKSGQRERSYLEDIEGSDRMDKVEFWFDSGSTMSNATNMTCPEQEKDGTALLHHLKRIPADLPCRFRFIRLLSRRSRTGNLRFVVN